MINYNCTGERRKKLVQALTKITGEPSVYLGIPTCGFRVGDYTVSVMTGEWREQKAVGLEPDPLPPDQTQGNKSADIVMGGVIWEIKSPVGNTRNTIKHNLDKAKTQSRNIIVDLARCKMPDEQAIKDIKYYFHFSKRLLRMKVITKDRKILDIPK